MAVLYAEVDKLGKVTRSQVQNAKLYSEIEHDPALDVSIWLKRIKAYKWGRKDTPSA